MGMMTAPSGVPMIGPGCQTVALTVALRTAGEVSPNPGEGSCRQPTYQAAGHVVQRTAAGGGPSSPGAAAVTVTTGPPTVASQAAARSGAIHTRNARLATAAAVSWPWALDMSRTRVRNQRRTTNPAKGFCDAPCMGHLLGYAASPPATSSPSSRSTPSSPSAVGCYRAFTETACGARSDRPAYGQLLDQLRPGDTLDAWRLERLGRSLRHPVDTVTSLAVRSPQEATETTTPGRQVRLLCLCGPGRVRTRPHPRTHRCGAGRRQDPRPPRRPAVGADRREDPVAVLAGL